ncbi:unnamed protein product [marine sediment metagenome]|uniref:Uncharacterized protein n=1 Tax=marine sediment metagenome TaxID=412755 RepID=X1RWX8_9ZZZZ
MEPVAAAKLDAETTELANRVRKARLQQELDDIDDRKQQRQEVDDMRLRERKLLLQLDETRLGASKGDSAVVGELTELRRELGDLRESRHQAELRQSEDRHSSEMRQVLAGIQRTGLTEMDILARVLDKGENLAIMVTDKVDRLVKSGQGDKTLMTALQLGLTPSEFQLLQQGEELVPTREDFEVGRRYRAHRDGVPYVEPESGEFEGVVSLVQRHNLMWQTAMDKAQRAMGKGGRQAAVRTGKPGQVPVTGVPEPGEQQPVVLKAESKVVQCTRCGSTFDIDLAEARSQAGVGKRLFIHCANPKCGFMLDLKELIPELQPAPGPEPVADRSTTPKCYVPGTYGECVSDLRSQDRQCGDCAWSG